MADTATYDLVSTTTTPCAARFPRLHRHRTTLLLAALLAALAWHPPHGLNLQICPTMNALGVPCPGCGLTRSMSCSLRGLWAEAWHYHPWGSVFTAYLIVSLIASIVPSATRPGRAIDAARRLPVIRAIWYLGAMGFVAFGVLRAVWFALQ